MIRVLAADCPCQRIDPISCYTGAGTACTSKSNPLHKILSRERRTQPIGSFAVVRWNDRLIHEVVTENGGTAFAFGSNGLPEACLDIPASLLRKRIVPRRDILFVVGAQACKIEVDLQRFGQLQKPSELAQLPRVGFARIQHESAKLKVHTNDVCSKVFHLSKVIGDFVPVLLPIVFDEAAAFIVIVIEAPRMERAL